MCSQSETPTALPSKERWFWLVPALLLLAILLLRVGMMAYNPLFDITETRYASIAQVMVLTRDWITPQLPTGQGPILKPFLEPFLGKPPLSFWLVASAYRFLGCNELTARLPNLLEAMATLGFTLLLGRRLFPTERIGGWAAVILASSLTFFIEAGTVSMDMLVCLGVTGGMWAFVEIQSLHRHRVKGLKFLLEILLGLFLGIGMLNKGPVSLVLGLGPLVLLSLVKSSRVLNKRDEQQPRPNWFWVFGVALGVSAPWFWAAQKANPDFLNYFFVHENFYRFIKPEYGDRYGSGHHHPYGMSWLFTLSGFMPWSLIAVFVAMQHHRALWGVLNRPLQGLRQAVATLKNLPEPLLFLMVWAVFAPLFFTVAKSIVFTYFSVSMPPLALLAACWLNRQALAPRRRMAGGLVAGALVLPVSIGCASVCLPPHSPGLRSLKSTVAKLTTRMPNYHRLNAVCMGGSVPYSWYFYTLAPAINQPGKALLRPADPSSQDTLLVVVGQADLQRFRQKYPALLALQHQVLQNGPYTVYSASSSRFSSSFFF